MSTIRRWLLLILTAGVLLAPLPVWAQGAGPINPSTITWTAPTTNDCSTFVPCPACVPPVLTCPASLTDLAGYTIRVAGPLPSTVCPTYSVTAYPAKKSVASAVTTPVPNTTVKFGTDGSLNLSGDLGLTADGQYCTAVTAVDLALNESAGSATSPFVRNRLTPSVVPGVSVNP